MKIWRQVAARKLEIQDFLRAEMDLKQKNSGYHLGSMDSNRRLVDLSMTEEKPISLLIYDFYCAEKIECIHRVAKCYRYGRYICVKN